MKRRAILAILPLAACLLWSDAASAEEAVFSVTTKGEGDRITVQRGGNAAIIDVQSPTGIGSAVLRLVSGAMPERVLVRLHLGGLEEFRLSYAETIVAASVSSDSGHALVENDIPNGERPLMAGHPLWMDIKRENGYFEIAFPKGFAKAANDSFEIRWIDFYR
jgi:hypothetical protein